MCGDIKNNQFIENSIKKYGSEFSYEKVKYISSREHVKISCKKHGDFMTTPQTFLGDKRKYGCRKCWKEEKVLKAEKVFMKKAPLIHEGKLNFSCSQYKGCKKIINVKCLIHNGIFTSTPSKILQGHGCRRCSSKRAGRMKSLGISGFLKKVKIVHGNLYNYSLVKYDNSKKKVVIICKKHGSFEQTPEMHMAGQGCVKCGHERSNNSRRMTKENFINRAIDLHGNRCLYSEFQYVSSKTTGKIFCNRCAYEFSQTPADHLNCKEPCPKCGCRHLDQGIFLQRAREIHGNQYGYEKVEIQKAKDKIIINCSQHGDFEQTPDNHLNGKGCKRCVKLHNSRGVQLITNFLEADQITYETEKSFASLASDKGRPLRFDFYVPIHRVLIEFDGQQHFYPSNNFGRNYSFERQKQHDEKKNRWAKENDFTLIRISYAKMNKINEILSCYFMKN